MAAYHPLPHPLAWLFSDARSAAAPAALARLLPPGSGIVLRHDDLPAGARWRLARRLARVARARRLLVLLAGDPAAAKRWGFGGVHLRRRAGDSAARARRLGLLVSMPVHDIGEARRARRAGADFAFVSPFHPTRSHPGAAALGIAAWLRLARLAGARPVALGGMTAARHRALRRAAVSGRITPGWAAIDAWDEKAARKAAQKTVTRRQKRNCVPT